MDHLHRTKQTAMALYDLMFNQGHSARAVAVYAGDTYIQHHLHVGDGKQALIASFECIAHDYPGSEEHRRESGGRKHDLALGPLHTHPRAHAL